MTEKTVTDCPVCGAFKHGFEEFCQDCSRQQRIVKERMQQAARDRRFGPLWPR